MKNNKKIAKIFCINFEATSEFLVSLDQFNLLVNEFKNKLMAQVIEKGYNPIEKARVLPFLDLNKNFTDPTKYRISIKAIYVGKKKARALHVERSI